MAEGGGLLNRYRLVKAYRGFESLRLRQSFHSLHSNPRFFSAFPCSADTLLLAVRIGAPKTPAAESKRFKIRLLRSKSSFGREDRSILGRRGGRYRGATFEGFVVRGRRFGEPVPIIQPPGKLLIL